MKFQKRLSLNKEIITKLNDEQMNQLRGGVHLMHHKTISPNDETHRNTPTESYVSGGCSNMCTQWKCNKV